MPSSLPGPSNSTHESISREENAPNSGDSPRRNARWLPLRVIVALVPVICLYLLSRQPTLAHQERNALASHFRFDIIRLPDLQAEAQNRDLSEHSLEKPSTSTSTQNLAFNTVRKVNPSLDTIQAWISSVGAGIAINDLDGDGLPNDICRIDTRTNQVIVQPVPGTEGVSSRGAVGGCYKPFTLNPSPLPYDSTTMAPMGCLPGDFNEDGLTDILVYYWGRSPILFLRCTEPKGTPLTRKSYVPCELIPHKKGEKENPRWFTNAVTQADLDGDGHIDLVIANYFQDGAHIIDPHSTCKEQMQDSMSHAFNGGRKHFFLWQKGRGGDQPEATFREVEPELQGAKGERLDRTAFEFEEVMRGWTLGISAADLDGDMLPELYLANDFGPDRLLHNRSMPGRLCFALLNGEKKLTTPKSKVVGQDSFKGMGVDFCDLFSKGRMDILVSDITGEYALEESNLIFVNTGDKGKMRFGIAPFEDRSEELGLSRSGWNWDIKTGDFDNDGVPEVIQAAGFVQGETNRWPELHEVAMANDNLLHLPTSWHRVRPGDDLCGHQYCSFFARSASGRYFDIAKDLHLEDTMVSRGIATADVFGDGNLDFAVASQWRPAYYYRNHTSAKSSQSGTQNTYLGLYLRLPVGDSHPSTTQHGGPPTESSDGRPAIGANALVTLPDGRRTVAQVDGGSGHSGKRSFDIHFGLGALPANTPLPVTLTWRDVRGTVHQETRTFTPGSHTVLLGPSR